MAWGAGTFSSFDKKIPGTYINTTSDIADITSTDVTGVVALPLLMEWGSEEFMEITKSQFTDENMNCLKIFGVPRSDPSLWYLREVFCHAKKVLVQRVNTIYSNNYTPKVGNEGSTAKIIDGDVLLAESIYKSEKWNNVKCFMKKEVDGSCSVVCYTGVSIDDRSSILDSFTIHEGESLPKSGSHFIIYSIPTDTSAHTYMFSGGASPVVYDEDNFKGHAYAPIRGGDEDTNRIYAKYPGLNGNNLQLSISAELTNNIIRFTIDVLYPSIYGTKPIESVSFEKPNEKRNIVRGICPDKRIETDFIIIPSTTTFSNYEEDFKYTVNLTNGESGMMSLESLSSFFEILSTKLFNTFVFHSYWLFQEEEEIYEFCMAALHNLIEERNRPFSVITFFHPYDTEKKNHTDKEYMVICVTENEVTLNPDDPPLLVYQCGYDTMFWVAGASASCSLSTSLMNMEYDGELTLETRSVGQSTLESYIEQGYFAFHLVNDNKNVVFSDINNFVTFTEEKGRIFSKNQTMRIIQYLKVQIPALFNTKYLGKVPNDDAGRFALWNDFVKIALKLQTQRAIQNFQPSDIEVTNVESDATAVYSVWNISIALVMEKLYLVLKLV